MSWKHVLLVGVLAVLTACSAPADPHQPPPMSVDSEAASPYSLSRVQALDAVSGPAPRGFTTRLTCLSREDEGCDSERTREARWFVGTLASGAVLPEGNGLREWVTTIVTAWPSAARARAAMREARRDVNRFRGRYDIALESGPETYVPGDRGTGEVQDASLLGWRGVGLRRVFLRYFDTDATSGSVLGGRFVLRKGSFVVDVEWTARTQATDRHLSRLTARLIRSFP